MNSDAAGEVQACACGFDSGSDLFFQGKNRFRADAIGKSEPYALTIYQNLRAWVNKKEWRHYLLI